MKLALGAALALVALAAYLERLVIRSTAVTYAERNGALVPVKTERDPFSDYFSDPGDRTLVLEPPPH